MKPYKKITFLYFSFGVLWIFLSDRLLSLFAASSEALTSMQTYKGWFFIIITSILLYTLMRRMFYELKNEEEAKEKVFSTTMRAVHHILNNFLHKMMFIKYNAEESRSLGHETLELYEKVIGETSKQINELSCITHITPEEIERTVYPSKSSQ